MAERIDLVGAIEVKIKGTVPGKNCVGRSNVYVYDFEPRPGRRFCEEMMGGLLSITSGSLKDDIESSESASKTAIHSRRRRYVVFPEGSSLTVAACVSPTALSGTGPIFTSGLAWAMSYDLPNETTHTKDNKYEFPLILKRHKRDLYIRMEKLMDSAGLNGRSCVLKTLCETAQVLIPRQGILEEILRLIFTYSSEKKEKYTLSGSKIYSKAYAAGEKNKNCNDLFPCPISLLELGLGFGKYPQI